MISVIVPVYNVEKYLDQCVQSILAQTYKSFELILVDDGSTDNSSKMCDEYAGKDKRVRVIHKLNGGLSDARNYGTNAAKGEFITYVDSDDYVSNDYLYKLIYLTKRFESDISVTGIERFMDGTVPHDRRKKCKEICLSGHDALKRMLYQIDLDTSACAILIKKSIAKEYAFPVHKYHEDDYTTYKYYISADQVAITTKKQYFYRQRHNSIMHSYGADSIDELDASDNIENVCKQRYPELLKAARSKKFSNYFQVLLGNPNLKQNNLKAYRKIEKYLLSYRWNMFTDKEARNKNRIAALALIIGIKPILLLNGIKTRRDKS